jgi:hypothetical protein
MPTCTRSAVSMLTDFFASEKERKTTLSSVFTQEVFVPYPCQPRYSLKSYGMEFAHSDKKGVLESLCSADWRARYVHGRNSRSLHRPSRRVSLCCTHSLRL